MIRYVLAVVLTVALVGLGFLALEEGATVRGEMELETAVDELDQTATALYQTADPPVAGERPPQRQLELTVPGNGPTSTGAERFTIERIPGEETTLLTYRLPGRSEQVRAIEVPMRVDGEDTAELAGYTGAVAVTMTLQSTADGTAVVDIELDEVS